MHTHRWFKHLGVGDPMKHLRSSGQSGQAVAILLCGGDFQDAAFCYKLSLNQHNDLEGNHSAAQS